MADWITAFQQHIDGYVQFAKDSLALEEAISPKGKNPDNSPVYARKFEYAPKRFTENYSQRNSAEAKTVLFVENGNDEAHYDNDPHDEVIDSNHEIFNPNIEDIDAGNPGAKYDEEIEIQNE